MLYKRTAAIFVISVVLILSGCGVKKNYTSVPDVTGEFNFTVLKSGQADAIILHTQNHSVIIDCGEKDDGDEVVKYLNENNITNLDYIFITHFDKDHVGGVPEVIKNIDVDNIIVPNYEGNNKEYEKYISALEKNDLSATVLTERMTFVLDDVLFEVFPPQRNDYTESDNDFSLVISITHGDNTFLFAGDAEADRLTEVISEFGNHYAFLKVPHHGKCNKNTKSFINTITPQYSVITDSDKNPADDKTISYLKSVGSEVYTTKNGNVYVCSNGEELEIFQ